MQCLVYSTVYITLKYTVYSVHYSVHCTLILFFFKLILIHQLHMCIQFRFVFIAYTMQINHCFKNVNPLMIPPPPQATKNLAGPRITSWLKIICLPKKISKDFHAME